jgi:hypothetical protein
MMSAKAEKTARNLHLVVCILSLAFLSFVAGGIAALADALPGRMLANAYKASLALHARLTQYREPFQLDLWRPSRTEARGVVIHQADKTDGGFTLYTSGHAQKAFLIDMDGRLVHAWGVPFSKLWDKSAAVRWPQPDTHVYIEKAVLYPNGDLLAIYVAVGDTPWGYGLVKLDKDSNVVWKYLAHAHHDVDVGPDGRVYVLTNEIGRNDVPEFPHLKAPRIEDSVAILSADGAELKKINLFTAMLRSPYARLLDTVPWYTRDNGDYLHTNAVKVLDGTSSSKLPHATRGSLLVSLREIGTIAILDVESEQIVWAARGPWLRQHDPDLLPNGNLMLFDNQGNIGPGGLTRVIEYDPAAQQIVWTYAGTPGQPFESEVRSSQEPLPDGNILITESDGGRLLEITPAGEIVWSYVNPVRGGEHGELIPILAWGQRIDPAKLDLGFAGTLVAGHSLCTTIAVPPGPC